MRRGALLSVSLWAICLDHAPAVAIDDKVASESGADALGHATAPGHMNNVVVNSPHVHTEKDEYNPQCRGRDEYCRWFPEAQIASPASAASEVLSRTVFVIKTYNRPGCLVALLTSIAKFAPSIPCIIADDSDTPTKALALASGAKVLEYVVTLSMYWPCTIWVFFAPLRSVARKIQT
jgi:hypothetical protein